MRRTGYTARPAYTLLEVLLATAIGLILLGALYVAVNVQLRHAQAGRDAIEHTTLARAILVRMANDINQCLAAYNPNTATPSSSSGGRGGGTGGSGQAGAASGSSASAGTGSSSAGSTVSAGTASSGGGTASANTAGTASNSVQINYGVQGDASTLTLSVGRLPREFTLGTNSDSATNPTAGVSDLRFISYWLVGDNGSAQGLARQDYAQVTSTDALNVLPPNVPDPASCVIAEEVKSLTFSYYDGSTWQASWDSTTAGPDGVTPVGPPVAIAIVLGIAVPGQADLKQYRHVVPVPTANNLGQVLYGTGSSNGTTTAGAAGSGGTSGSTSSSSTTGR